MILKIKSLNPAFESYSTLQNVLVLVLFSTYCNLKCYKAPMIRRLPICITRVNTDNFAPVLWRPWTGAGYLLELPRRAPNQFCTVYCLSMYVNFVNHVVSRQYILLLRTSVGSLRQEYSVLQITGISIWGGFIALHILVIFYWCVKGTVPILLITGGLL